MKHLAPIATAWIATCGAAYYLGSESSKSSIKNSPSQNDRSTIVRIEDRSRNLGSATSLSQSGSIRNGKQESSKNPAARIVELSNLSDPIKRTQALLVLIDQLSPEEFQEVVASFRETGNIRERMGEYTILLTAWAKADPVGALEYSSEHTNTPFARQTILATWAKTQPEAAISWAREHHDGEEDQANPWLVGIIKGIAQTDLTRATSLLEELPYSRGRGDALSSVLKKLRSQGVESAQEWITGLGEEQLQNGAAARLAQEMGEDDPIAALDWAATISEEALARSAGEVVEGWTEKDPVSAQTWLDQQPEDIRARAARGFIDAIARADPETASTWLSGYKGNPAYDDAVRELVWSTAESDPVMSGSWIMNLTEERDQTRTFHRALRGMMGTNAEATMEFINSTETLPDGIRQRATVYYEERNK